MPDIITCGTNMKHLRFLFFSLFVAACSAVKCVPTGELDAAVIYNPFQTGASNVPVPHLEYGDNAGTNFSTSLNRAIKSYALTVVNNVNCQAMDAGVRVSNCLKKASHDVIEATKSKNQEYGEEANANGELQKLTSLLTAVIELEPGNVEITNTLPALPHQPVEYHSRTRKRSLKELFTKFDTILNSQSSDIFGYISTSFLTGWRDARLGFHEILWFVRREILNNEILAAARASVDKIYNRGDVVQKCVLPETWKSFQDASYRIITASNDYNASQDGGDGCSSCTHCPYRLN